MNIYVKRFLHRGFVFGGMGPVITGLVFLIVSAFVEGVSLTGKEIFVAILSTYLLAFFHAGASVFNQIEHWSVGKSILFHFLTLYASYSLCYFVNSWIPFEPIAFLIFTGVFVAVYVFVWLAVLIGIRITQKRLNRTLEKK